MFVSRASKSIAVCATTLAFGLALFSAVTFAQVPNKGTLQVVSSGYPHDSIYSIAFEGVNGIAVGTFGLMLTTIDGGSTWKKVDKALTQDALFSVVRRSGKCLASSQLGIILRSDDCNSWESIKPISNARLLAIDVNSSGHAVSVGSFGTIMTSADWGKTWNQTDAPWKTILGQEAEPHLYATSIDEAGVITIAGEFELLMRSVNSGKSWTVLHKGAHSLFALQVSSDGQIYAVGQEGLILKSSNNGTSWSKIKTSSNALLTDIWLSRDTKTVVATGMRTLLQSKNSGKSFKADTSSLVTQSALPAVTGYESAGQKNTIFISGSAGQILKEVY